MTELRNQKCKHTGCDNKRFLRLWACGYCYNCAFKYAPKFRGGLVKIEGE